MKVSILVHISSLPFLLAAIKTSVSISDTKNGTRCSCWGEASLQALT